MTKRTGFFSLISSIGAVATATGIAGCCDAPGPFEQEPEGIYEFICYNNGNNWWQLLNGTHYHGSINVCVDVVPQNEPNWKAKVKAACTQQCIGLAAQGQYLCDDGN